MKKLLLLILPLLAITFNSCSKDDDGGSSNGAKLVKQIVDDVEWSHDFAYDSQERITKITTTHLENPYEKHIANIAYSNNKVTVTYDGGTTTLTLDNNGYVTIGDYNDDRGSSTYEYSNGVITKSNYDDCTITYTWANGNLNKAVYKYPYGGGDDVNTYEYGNVENKININCFFADFCDAEWLLFKGMMIKNLPISRTSDEETTTYTYTFDSDGYPTKIVTTDSYGSETTTLTYY